MPIVLKLQTIHPLIVQFATVLLFITPISLVIWSHVQTPAWHVASLMTGAGGALSATLAYPTGLALIPHGINPELMELRLGLHQTFGLITLLLAWVLVAMHVRAYVIAEYTPEVASHLRVPYRTRFSVVAVSFICGACAAYTSHLGVSMVWGKG